MNLNELKSKRIDVNLRTHGWGLFPQGEDLVLGAVISKSNSTKFMGHLRIEGYASLSDEVIQEKISEFVDDHKMGRGEAFLGISREEVKIQIAEFPSEAEETLDEVIQYQIENIFPGDFENFEFFHQVIFRGDQLRVMVVAIPRETLGSMFAFIRRFKISLAGITLLSFANLNGLRRLQGEAFAEKNSVVLHFYRNGIEFCGIRSGVLYCSHYFELPEENWESILIKGLEDGLGRTRLAADEIDHFYMVGQAPLPWVTYLTEQIGLPLEIAEDHLKQEIPCEAMPAVGLGITAVQPNPPFAMNVLPIAQRKRRRQLPLMIAGILGIAALLFFGITEVRTYFGLRNELAQIVEQNSRMLESLQEKSDISTKYQAAKAEEGAYRPYLVSDTYMLKILLSLAQELPDHTFLNSMSIKGTTDLTLTGESDDPYEVRSHLQSLNLLRKVEFSGPVQPVRKSNKKRFTLKAEVQLEAFQ